jgi:curli biogenesis system outer membrane secretion channel CsgG
MGIVEDKKTGKVHIKVAMRLVRVTIVAVEK